MTKRDYFFMLLGALAACSGVLMTQAHWPIWAIGASGLVLGIVSYAFEPSR